ncbi:MAG TPA: ATPase, T2SS/T4P/T4SS family, partial [Candidatus Hydrogenedentes bacterium]|nr:ATPase, T2SS/T4P/T4SS family [Candidatus Hydrogenedentota bacterium]
EFREHTNEKQPLAYARMPAQTAQAIPELEVELRLDITPSTTPGAYDVRLSAGRSTALRSVMRQDPDVILIGEMRDIETFQAAISASETGHLVFSTLHTTNAMQTVDRIIDLFPSTQHDQVRSQLSINLRAMMCMRLLPRKDGIGRVPICEVMFNTPAVRKLIKENRVAQITLAIQQGREAGMQTFNDSLHDLVRRNLVSLDVALEASDNPEELQMMLQGIRLSSTRGGILGA